MTKRFFSFVMAVVAAITLTCTVSYAAVVENGVLTTDLNSIAPAGYFEQEQKSIIVFFSNDSDAWAPKSFDDVVIIEEGETLPNSYPITIPEMHKDNIVVIFGGSNDINVRTVIPLSHVSHWYSEEWSTDETYHWKECGNSECNFIADKAEHTNGGDDGICTTPVLCSCGYTLISGAEGHIYTDVFDASCNNQGCTYSRTPSAVTVTFDVNGGTALESNMITTAVSGKITADLPVPVRNGWSFNGWYTATTGGTKIEKNISVFYTATTVYAQWTHVSTGSGNISTGGGGGGGSFVGDSTYTLTFETNGGSAIKEYTGIKDITVHLGDYVTSKKNCEFEGWYRDSALTDKISTLKLTADTTVYAKWLESDSQQEIEDSKFSDVTPDDWFEDAVTFVLEKGLMNGTGNDRFEPNGKTTRAMLVTILHRLEGKPQPEKTIVFSDVNADAYYKTAVGWAAEKNIVGGYGNGLFGSDDAITREQIAVILYRYAEVKGYEVKSFADTDISKFSDEESVSEYAESAIRWAYGTDLINGSENKLIPNGEAERCQIAAILMRFCEFIEK